MTERGTPYEGSRPSGKPPATPTNQRRIALVIGNGAYTHASKLDNPANDARAMSARFEQLGFEVFTGLDLNYRDLGRLAVEFEKAIRGIDVALLYYAGHGLQVHGKNYLVPVDAEIQEVGELKFNTVLFDDVLEPMTRLSKTALVFLDACRDNPFARNLARSMGQRSISGGLAEIKSDDGSFIAFATAPDRVAFDGHGGNSPFTTAMLEHIATPGLSLSDMMVDVRNTVREATKGKQVPWEHSSLFSKFYFVPKEDEPAPQPAMSAAAEEWASVQNTTSLATLALFKERYPDPPWGEYADIRAGELRLADQQRRELEQRHAEAEAARAKAAEEERAKTEKLAAMAAALETPATPEVTNKPQSPDQTAASTAPPKPSARKHEDRPKASDNKPFPVALIGGGAAVAVAALLAIWQPWSSARLRFEPEMVRVPGGTFRMGCVSGKSCESDEKPVHRVTIKPFEVGKYEVTFAQWDACVADGGCTHKPKDEGWGRGKRPVINVSWDDITKQYLPWLSAKTGNAYRLLTEAEWEYAARAGSRTKYGWGNSIANACKYANHADKSVSYSWKNKECSDGVGELTTEVGRYSPNTFGLYDMHGNIWEWVQDCYKDSYKGAPRDGSKAPDTDSCRRVVRGGSWYFNPRGLRSASRIRLATDIRINYIGFRLARTLNP